MDSQLQALAHSMHEGHNATWDEGQRLLAEIERKERIVSDVIDAIGTSVIVDGQTVVRLLRSAL